MEKPDCIQRLGVNRIWFSPLYPSPNADYGYDVADCMDIHPDHGTPEDIYRDGLLVRELYSKNAPNGDSRLLKRGRLSALLMQ